MKTSTLYIAGLDPSIDDAALRAEFEKHAVIERGFLLFLKLKLPLFIFSVLQFVLCCYIFYSEEKAVASNKNFFFFFFFFYCISLITFSKLTMGWLNYYLVRPRLLSLVLYPTQKFCLFKHFFNSIFFSVSSKYSDYIFN